MNKKTVRIISLLLAVIMLVQPSVRLHASSRNTVQEKYVMAFLSARKCRLPVRLIYDEDTVYIAAEDIAAAAKMKGEGTSVSYIKSSSGTTIRDNVQFTREGSVFSEKVNVADCFLYQERWYVPLQSTAKKLHVRYMYDEDSRTLIFQHTEKLEEDLIDLAMFILGKSKESNNVQRFYLGNMVSMEEGDIASAFNILTEKGIFAGLASYLTGSYEKEKYAVALASILSDNDAFSLANKTEKELKEIDDGIDAYVNLVSTADELTVSLENDLEAQGINLFEHFGEYALTFGFRMSDADQILKTYHEMEYFGPGDFLALYHHMTLREQSNMLFVRAFNYGLGMEKEMVSDKGLKSAIEDVYPFTKDGETESVDTLNWVLQRTAKKWMGKAAQKAAKEIQKKLIQDVTSDVMGQTKLSLEEIFTGILTKGLLMRSTIKKRTDAVEQAYLLSKIQDYAANTMELHCCSGDSSYSPTAVKYALILYLRAAQAAYENYRFDKDMRPYVNQAVSSLEDLIIKAASWQDEHLGVSDKAYPKLDITQDGFFDSLDEQGTLALDEQVFADSVMMSACGYLFSQGEQYRAYRFDWDHNGVSDLMITKKDDPTVFCAVSGAEPFRNQTYLISKRQDSQVYRITYENGITDMVILYRNELGQNCYAPFTGYQERPLAIELPASEETDNQHLWSVNECLYTDDEFNDQFWGQTLSPINSNYIDGSFYSLDSDLPASEIERLSKYFPTVSEVKQTQMADVNDDGVRDLALRISFRTPKVILDGENVTNEAETLKEYGYADGELKDAGVLIMSNEGKILVAVYSWEEVLEKMGKASGGESLSNGIHQLIIYSSQVTGNANDGYLVKAYELEYVTYEDSVIRSLKEGDKIGNIVIEEMDWVSDSFLSINDSQLMLSRLVDGLWYQVEENDILVSVETNPFNLFIPAGVEYLSYEENPVTPKKESNLEALLSLGYDGKEQLEFWVEGGNITQIVRQYRP